MCRTEGEAHNTSPDSMHTHHPSGSPASFAQFTHVTRFLGHKVVLLGLYNGQKLEGESQGDINLYSRSMHAGEHGNIAEGPGGGDSSTCSGSTQNGGTRDRHMYSGCCGRGGVGAVGSTFVRVLLLRGRLQGAVLVGETDLEETFENLILDGLDVSAFGPSLLDPNIELDHVFD